MEKLEELIDRYGLNDAEKKDYDTICKDLNKQIKNILREQLVDNKATATGNTYKVSLSVTEKENINEEALINLLKSKGYTTCIKTVEVIDEDALEKAMYQGNIDESTLVEMGKLTTKTNVETLRVSLIKKGDK